MTKKPTGCLAVALLLTGMVLAGCIGSEAGGGPQADNATDPADDVEQNQNTTDADADSGVDDTNATEDEGDDEPRVPSGAMDGEPADTSTGMARFTLQGTVGDVSVTTACFEDACSPSEATYEETFDGIHLADDIVFMDAYMKWNMGVKSDLDLYMYNEDGDEVTHSTRPDDEEYMFLRPTDSHLGENYSLSVKGFSNLEPGTEYEIVVSFWTVSNYTYNVPWDIMEKRYEIGQAETAAVSIVWSPILTTDWTGQYDEEGFDMGGISLAGCAVSMYGAEHQGNGSTWAGYDLPCPESPYKSVSIVINDDFAGQQVAAIWTTCSNDGDNWCGEEDNTEGGNGEPGTDGPDELQATFCGVINGLTRDGTSDADGTGPGVWDQRGEEYKAANGTYMPHPGVDTMAIFLRGPQRGGGGICPDANPYTGPTQGTITILAEK